MSRTFKHTDVQEGDRVKCNVRGRQFSARVRSVLPDGYGILPDSSNVTYYRVSKRQVVEHFSQTFDPTTTQVTS